MRCPKFAFSEHSMMMLILVILTILSHEVHISSAAPAPVVNEPVCDVSVESSVCLHRGQRVLLPQAKPYGLVLHIDFDSVRPLDSSGEKNHAAGAVMAATGLGGVGSSGLFRQNFVVVPHSNSFTTADFSVTMFIYLLEDAESIKSSTRHDQYCPIFHKGIMSKSAVEAVPAILLDPRTGRVKVVISTTATLETAGEEMESNFKLRKREWNHLSFVRTHNTARLYINGHLDSIFVTEGSTRTNDLPIYIGGAPYAESVCDMPLLLDEVKMYNVAIGRDQVQAEASAVLGGIEPSYIYVACLNCQRSEAISKCPKGYHLCNKLELYTGGYQVARKLSIDVAILAADSEVPRKGAALCCADAH